MIAVPTTATVAPRHLAFGLGVVLTISVLLLADKFILPLAPLDEGITLVYPDLILKGYLPNLDFCSLYAPGNYWFLAAAFKLFGASLTVERLVGLGYVFGIAGAVFFIALDLGLVVAVVLATSVSMVLQIFYPAAIAAYAWFGAVALMLWSLAMASGSRQGRSLVAAGMLAGFAITFRHDLAVVMAISGLAVVGWQRDKLLRYGIGFLFGIMAFAVHFVIATPEAVITNLVWDVLRAGPTRRLPLNLHSPLLWSVGLSCVVPALLAGLGFQRIRRLGDRTMFGIGVVCLGVLPQAVQRADRWHLAYVGCFTIPLAAVAVLKFAKLYWPQAGDIFALITDRRYRLGSVGAMIIAMVAIFAQWTMKPFSHDLSNLGLHGGDCAVCVVNEGRVAIVGGNQKQLQKTIDELEARSRPGQTLFVGPLDLTRTAYNNSFLYFLFPKLKPSAYYIEMAPAVTNRAGSRLATDVATAQFALLDRTYDLWDEPNGSGLAGSSEASMALARDFCLVAMHDPYRLYQKCDRPNPS